MSIVFEDRIPTKPGRVKLTPEDGGAPFYAIMERADEPTKVGTPINAAALNSLVRKSGDTLSGSLVFENVNSYHALMKYRDINGVRYGVNVGCGTLGGQGVVAIEARQGYFSDSPILGRLEVGDLGVSYQDDKGKRIYLATSEVIDSTVG